MEGAVLRLRPIMMTMLVASLGLLPAALSRGIGSDSQRPFAIVIVGGLIAALILGVFLLPTLYVWVASNRDALPIPRARTRGIKLRKLTVPIFLRNHHPHPSFTTAIAAMPAQQCAGPFALIAVGHQRNSCICSAGSLWDC